jgi:multidrug efflux pump
VPRLALLALGGWLGWEFLGPWLNSYLPPPTNGWLPEGTDTLWTPGLSIFSCLVGGAAGWCLGPLLNLLLAGFFRLFNAAFRRGTGGYVRLVGAMLRISVVVLVVYGGMMVLTYGTFASTRRGFIPQQDMGYLMINVQLPDAASTERTDKVMRQMEKIALRTPGIRHVTTIAGMSFVLNANGSNFGSCFINLQPYPERRDPSLSAEAIANSLRRQFGEEIFDANVAVFPPPPVRGVGRAGGFAIMIEDRGDLGPSALQEQVENLSRLSNQPDPKKTPELLGPDGRPRLVGMFSVFRANVPQIHLAADPGAVSLRGVTVQDLAQTLEVYEGSVYVNDFNLFGRTWQVIVQADARFRSKPEDLFPLRARNFKRGMVPLGSLGTQHEVNGPLVLTRYNMYPAAALNGSAGPDVSSGQVMDILRGLAERELPSAMGYEWTDMSYLELIAGNTAMMIFGLAVFMVFLVLAAQYESWSLPLAVILVVPMCLLSAIVGVRQANQDINIFTQIGFVVLVGLASKNAILIVEFAKLQRHEGKSRREATLEACKLRLRPIVMTSLAFILGVVPLIVSTGAGAEMRRTLGTAVFSGMLGVTLFGIVLTPVFFFTIDWLGERFSWAGTHWLGRVALYGIGLLMLGIPWLLVWATSQATSRSRGRARIAKPMPETGRANGQIAKTPTAATKEPSV